MSRLKVDICSCLNQVALDCLKAQNITTVIDYVSRDVEEIAERTGISYKVGHFTHLWFEISVATMISDQGFWYFVLNPCVSSLVK